MLTMKKESLVVRVSRDKRDQYESDGWRGCCKKVWRRSAPAMLKDGSGPSKNVRIDPVPERANRPTGKVYVLSKHYPTSKY